jgi:hypothetical protein
MRFRLILSEAGRRCEMRILVVGVFAIAMFGMPAMSLSATDAVDAEQAGAAYTLAMEGMT